MADSAGPAGDYVPVDVVAQVVQVRLASEESVGGVVPFIPNFEYEGCVGEVTISRIETVEGAWAVTLVFRAAVAFATPWGRTHIFRRLLFFRKRIPFPIGCLECAKYTPAVEVSEIECEVIPLREALRVTLHFQMVVKGLKREEITVLTVCD